jgi:YfiR/HmsC-like
MLQVKSLFFIIVMIFCFQPLYAAVYDSDILNTYSKLSPRIILMSTQKSKIINSINICLTYEPEDEMAAQEFISLTKANYPNGIQSHTIAFLKMSYENIGVCSNSHLNFILSANENFLKKVLLFSKTEKIMTMSYDDKLLDKGVDISLFIGRKISPHLNLQSISKKGIRLDNILLRISKVYTQNPKVDTK